MGRAYRLLLTHYLGTFQTLFFTLFFIASLLFFIGISKVTAVIKITFAELGELYLYLVPEITLYTLPIAAIAAITLSLAQMSKENELGALFSFGFGSNHIARLYFVLGLLTSLFLLVATLVLVPMAKASYKNFIETKKLEALINLKASELGQKFDDWYLFVSHDTEQPGRYQSIVMLHKDTNTPTEQLIIATDATVSNQEGAVRLDLEKGRLLDIKETHIDQIDFSKLSFHSTLTGRFKPHRGIIEFWMQAYTNKTVLYDFSFYLFLSFFPLIGFWIAIGIGIVNPRYDKRGVYLPLGGLFLGYFTLSYLCASHLPLWINLAALPLLAVAAGLFARATFFRRF